MDDFVDNWKIHRGKLVASVEAHQKMALDSADAYEDTDEGLAKELTHPGQPPAWSLTTRASCTARTSSSNPPPSVER